MDVKHFSLGINETNRIVRIFQILFGVVCLAVTFFWLIYNINSLKADVTLWITIIFLSGFGFYQIWSGLGRTKRFIEIGPDYIRLKKNPLFPPVNMLAGEVEKIEFLPLNVIFFFKTKKRILLRFGITYYETNGKIKDEILFFAESNKIPLEIIQEEL